MHTPTTLLVLFGAILAQAQNLLQSSFAAPGARQRPRFRYWIPDASVSLDVVSSDIQSAGSIGAGGVELLGFYNYGGEFGPPPAGIDWAVSGWGLPAWKKLQDVAIQAAASSNMVIDLTLGPNQGAGVPAEYDDPGRVWQLVPYNITVAAGNTFTDLLPGWGSGELVAATIGQQVSSENVTLINGGLIQSTNVSGTRLTLASSSLADVTSQVGMDGRINITMPTGTSNQPYVLFAFYQNHPQAYEAMPFNASVISSYLQNGSWVVDHFSATGAQTITHFWDQNLLTNNTRSLLQQVGNYVWEDSQEWTYELGGVTIMWTPALISHFEQSRGYALQKYLPLLVYRNNGNSGALVSTTIYATDESDGGIGHVSDYRQSLTELNFDYLDTLSEWAKTLGMQWSAQPGYNLELDMLATIPHVDVPETESLGFNDNLDAYRQFTGAAVLAGKRVISSELGAVFGEVYAETIPEILWHIKRSLVTSINAFVIHGLAWSGSYPSCTYPSYTTFAYLFSEMHGPHLPAWEYYGDWMNYTARSMYILQNSIPKYDIAFWLKSVNWETIQTRYYPDDLVSAGYTYQYLSPDNLDLPAVSVTDGTLAPTAQAFKAFVIRANDTLTASGVTKLSQLASAGLPIFFSGGLPYKQLGEDVLSQSTINDTIRSISNLTNVHIIPYDDLAKSLAQYGIMPRATVRMNTSVYAHWSKDNSSDYVTLYNDAPGFGPGQGSATGNVTLESMGNPYMYNAWTGDIIRLEVFGRDTDTSTITIPLTLAGNQTLIIAFNNTEEPSTSKIVSSENVASVTAISESEYEVKALTNKNASLTLANGTLIQLRTMTTPQPSLSNWTLILESWMAPTNISNSNTSSIRTNSTLSLDRLVPWNQITTFNLTSAAGRGYYNTTFQWNPSEVSIGLILDLGYIAHTARATVNGHALPSLDVAKPQMDIGSYLRNGTNTVEVVVSTPLSNALRPVASQLLCITTILPPTITETDNGLVTDVLLIPYVTQRLTL